VGPNPVLGPLGLKFSTMMAMLHEKKDEKATQVELLDEEEEDLTTVSNPSHLGLFQPLTTECLNSILRQRDWGVGLLSCYHLYLQL
jgi:hypothetical protein